MSARPGGNVDAPAATMGPVHHASSSDSRSESDAFATEDSRQDGGERGRSRVVQHMRNIGRSDTIGHPDP